MLGRVAIRTLVILIAGGVLVPAASATITASHEWRESALLSTGQLCETYWLYVHVTDTPGMGADDWTAAELEAEVIGGVFYQDLFGSDPPNPAFFPAFPDLEFDSYVTSPGDYPNAAYDGTVVGKTLIDPGPPPWRIEAELFDTIDTGNGDFVIAQVTVLPDGPDWLAVGHLRYTSEHAGGEWFDYRFVLPEPPLGDTDRDGDVDLGDLATLLAAYGSCAGDPGYNPDADFDDSGYIDLADLAALLSNYGFGT